MGSCISVTTKSDNGDSISKSHQVGKLHGQRIDLQHLASIPNRICTNGKSRSSCIFTQQGRKGINQDAMIVWEDFISDDVTFFGVFDGHGPYGHLVSRKVRDVLPVNLLSNYYSSKSRQNRSRNWCFGDPDPIRDGFTGDELDYMWRDVFLKSYKVMDKELRSQGNLDCFCSGSTAVTIVKQGSNLFIANIGDSRAVLGSRDGHNAMVATQLTIDLKPDLPKESERIKQCKGRVFAMEDEPEVCRVWLPFDDAPGLAMARAFGDFCLKNYGVISVPEFTHRCLTERDQFIVLASDGVWDVLSNEEVVEIVSLVPSRSAAARTVVDAASREWNLKYPTSRMDDCAVVCLYLDGKMESESDNDKRASSSATLRSNHSIIATELDGALSSEPTLQRNYTVRPSEDKDLHEGLTLDIEVVKQTDAAEDQTWSGLEGVTRVNSFVQLPRFSKESLSSQ